MSKNLEPGMLCLIIGGFPGREHNVGRIVLLEKYFPVPARFTNPDSGGVEWIGSPNAWMVRADKIYRYFTYLTYPLLSSFCFVDARYLMPLEGDQLEETEEQEVLHEGA